MLQMVSLLTRSLSPLCANGPWHCGSISALELAPYKDTMHGHGDQMPEFKGSKKSIYFQLKYIWFQSIIALPEQTQNLQSAS